MIYDLSVIIPVYNREKYINKCLNSLINIKNIKLEIIIIDDNSKDNSKEIIKNNYLKYNNIKFYELDKNHGASFCRNYGLKKASGNYITFLDSDDYIDLNMYNDMLKNCYKYDLDVCGVDYVEEYKDKTVKSKYHYNNELLNNKLLLENYLTDKISPAIWDKIYKKNIIENICFKEDLKIGEDILFCLNVFFKCNRSLFLNKEYYHYVQHDNSIMHNVSNNVLEFNLVLEKINLNIKNSLINNYKEEYEYFTNSMTLRIIHTYSNLLNKSNHKEIIKYIKNVYNKDKFKKFLKNKYLNKFLKIEIFVLVYFGIYIHLILFPIYKKIRSLIRR